MSPTGSDPDALDDPQPLSGVRKSDRFLICSAIRSAARKMSPSLKKVSRAQAPAFLRTFDETTPQRRASSERRSLVGS